MSAQLLNRHWFRVLICCVAISFVGALRLSAEETPPTILNQPRDEAIALGWSWSTYLEISGSPPLTFQWYRDGAPLSGQTNQLLYFWPVEISDAGTYFVGVRNSVGEVFSDLFTLTVESWAARIYGEPSSISGVEGIEATFSFGVDSAPPAPFAYQWRLNGTEIPGANSNQLVIANARLRDAGEYTVVATNLSGGGAVTSQVATLTLTPGPAHAGAVDLDFYPEYSAVGTTWVLEDRLGRILIGSKRLLPDGRLDSMFNPSYYHPLALESDGRILGFTVVPGSRAEIVRVGEDGTRDPTFSGRIDWLSYVADFARQEDGHWLVLDQRWLLARLNPDGSIDSTFPGIYPVPPVDGGTAPPVSPTGYAVVLDRNGRVLVGANQGLTRLTRFGDSDRSFVPDPRRAALYTQLVGRIHAVAPLPDDRVLLGGTFTNLAGVLVTNLGRLLPGGPVDPTFKSPFSGDPGAAIRTIAPLPDGRILVGGSFALFYAGKTNYGIVRLFADGTIDESFDPETGLTGLPGPTIFKIVARRDGKVLVAGSFHTMGGATRDGLAQLLGDPPRAPTILEQPMEQHWTEGQVGTLLVTASYPPEPEYQWYRHGLPIIGATNQVYRVDFARAEHVGDYSVIVHNPLGSVTSAVAAVTVTAALTIHSPGSLRISNAQFGPGTDGAVACSLRLADGRILIGGRFSTVNGVARTCLARLNPDGSVDPTFDAGSIRYSGFTGGIVSLSEDAAGRIYLAGTVTNIAGVARKGIARLLPDGELDLAFAPSQESSEGRFKVVAARADGRVVVGGLEPLTFDGIGDGTVTTLDPNGRRYKPTSPIITSPIRTLVVQPDGLALISGWGLLHLERLFGDPEFFFQPPAVGVTNQPTAMTVLADGRFAIAGDTYPWLRPSLFVLRRDGLPEPTFRSTNTFSNSINAIAADSCGRFIVGGAFNSVGGIPRNRIARILTDGSLDLGFSGPTNIDGYVNTIQVLPDDSVFIAGNFTFIDGVRCQGFAFLHGDPLRPPVITSNPLGGTAPTGKTYQLAITTECVPLMTVQWYRDGQPLAGETNLTLRLPNILTSQAGEYVAVVGNPAGTATSGVARLTVTPPVNLPGRPDFEFFTGSGPDNRVTALAVDRFNRVYLAGHFTNVNGLPRPYLARLDDRGAVDERFSVSLGNVPSTPVTVPAVRDCKLDALGRLWISGYFAVEGSNGYNFLVRLRDDGRLDPAFRLESALSAWAASGGGISHFLLPADGSVLIASGPGVRRVRSDGTSDPAFANGLLVLPATLVNLPDGRWMAGGYFTVTPPLGNQRRQIARFHPNGAIDQTFDLRTPPDTAITSMAVCHDNRILIGGVFARLGIETHFYLARLGADGRVESGFSPGWVASNAVVNAIVPMADGRAIIAGSFPRADGSRYSLARIREDGSLDPTFVPLPDVPLPTPTVLTLTPWGTILVGGNFSGPRPRVMRVHGDPTLVPVAVQSPAASFGLEAQTLTGRTYHLEFNETLGANDWQEFSSTAGDGAVHSFPVSVESRQRFFRLRVE